MGTNRYAYALNNPVLFKDPSGNYVEIVLEIVSIGLGASSAWQNFWAGNYGAAAGDAIGVGADIALAATPGAPGVIGLSRHGVDTASDIGSRTAVNRSVTNRTLFSQRPTSFDPMDEVQFRRIQEAFARQGGTIDSSEDALRFLESRGADGVTFNANTILVRPDASPSTVFEELIHTAQHRTGRFENWVNQYGNAGAVARAEHEAATRLVRNQQAYGISDAEHAVNLARVQEFRSQLDGLGISVD